MPACQQAKLLNLLGLTTTFDLAPNGTQDKRQVKTMGCGFAKIASRGYSGAMMSIENFYNQPSGFSL